MGKGGTLGCLGESEGTVRQLRGGSWGYFACAVAGLIERLMATVIDKMAYKAGDAFSFDLLRSFFKGDQKDTEIRKQRDIQLATDDNVLIWSEKEKQIIVFPKNALQSSICHCEAENETMLPSSKQAQFEFQVQQNI